MDKKLRQLENQSLPDLSKLDNHWQQMQQLLQDGAGTSADKTKTKPRRWWPWLIAAVLFSVVFITGYKLINSTKQADTNQFSGNTAQPSMEKKENVAPQTQAVIPAQPPVETGKINTGTEPSTQRKKILVSAPMVTITGNPAGRDTAMPAPVVTNQPVQSKKETVTLAGFFKQIEKQAQEIIINPRIANLVKGQAGTALLIPANTFSSNGPVTLLLKEYYSNEDIITNKLTTTSDGEPLVSGGMLHIQAFSNGTELKINPGMSIRWFIPDTSKSIGDMQLFTGNSRPAGVYYASVNNLPATGDTMASLFRTENINWVPDAGIFSTTYIKKTVKVLDLKDNPYKTRETKKGSIGKFHISSNPKISRKELILALKEKYGYYKVKLKNWGDDRYRHTSRANANPISGEDSWNAYEDVGDSAWIDKKLADRYKLKATDSNTVVVTARSVSGINSVSWSYEKLKLDELSGKYSVEIRTLGWINCDRFYRDNRPKIDYYVNVGDTASKYYTILVFESIKSMIPGYTSGNRVVFSNLPRGIKGKVFCIGIQDGKPVAAVADLPADTNTINALKFEETSPASFREQAAMTDK